MTGYPRGGLESFFGLWSVRFPLVLVRTGRRLPVQALGERGVLVSVTGYPRGGTVGPFTVLKFEDQTFISHIYYRRAPTFTTDSEANF